MTQNNEETTILNPSVDADGGQPSQNKTKDSIPDFAPDSKDYEAEMRAKLRKMDQMQRPDYLYTITMDELYDTVYQSKPPIIDGLLYTGTYIFAGAPKLGKSFLMLQLAYAVSTGTELWGFEVRQGSVLYLALEDDYRRLQARLVRMVGTEPSPHLHLSVTAKTMNEGLDKQLDGFLRDHPDTKLIIIDILQKVRDTGGEKYSYAGDYELVSRLKQFADQHPICLLLVHHTRKQQADDCFDMISGTTGLMGGADGAFLLQKENRTANGATLEVSGRDQQDQRLHLTRDTDTLLWMLDKADTELWQPPPEPLLATISEFLSAKSYIWEGTASELVDELGIDIKPNKLTMKLNVNSARLLSEHGIIYKNVHARTKRIITFQHADSVL